MRIILKPLGALCVGGAIAILAFLAFRNSGMHSEAVAAVPSVSAVAASAPAASTDMPSGQIIYQNGVENGWQAQGWTWAKQVDFQDTSHVHDGQTAIKAVFENFDGVKFHHDPQNVTPYDRVAFWVYGGAQGGQYLAVGGTAVAKGEAILGQQFGPLPANKWVSVTVPLAVMHLAKRTDMDSFWIQGNAPKPQAPVWIDGVRLLKVGEPSPGEPSLAVGPMSGRGSS